ADEQKGREGAGEHGPADGGRGRVLVECGGGHGGILGSGQGDWIDQEAAWTAGRGRASLAMTSSRGPNVSTAPPFSTRTRSTARSRLGRWVTATTVVPRAFSSATVRTRASSPSPSRLAFGSSRTTRRGLPNRA